MEGPLLYITLVLAAVGLLTILTAISLTIIIWRDRYLLKKQVSTSCFARLRIIQ